MREFKIHSIGDNWYHFRSNMHSSMESFSITYTHDGTVVMTGDMGVLAWQRRIFPDNPDYGFPDKNTGLAYFSEKIVRAEEAQKIRTWDREEAKKDILSSMDCYNPEHSAKELVALMSVYNQLMPLHVLQI